MILKNQFNQISEFSFKVENYVAEIEIKTNISKELKEHINNQQNEISIIIKLVLWNNW